MDSIFRPGQGIQPPVLAGREAEKRRLTAIARELQNHQPPSADVYILGPRGTGKTCLRNWFASELAHGTDVRCSLMVANEIKAPTSLFEELIKELPTSMAKRIADVLPGQIEVGIGSAQATWKRTHEPSLRDIRNAFAEGVQKSPFVLCIDEAHTLDPAVVGDILNLSQELRATRRAPFFLMLVGTPELQSTLQSAHATFFERSKKFRLGVLEQSEAERALREPFEALAVGFSPLILDEAVAKSQAYPYFIQLMGDCLQEALPEGEDLITQAVLDAATERFDREAAEFYQGRYSELEQEGLENAAVSLSRLFESRHHEATFLSRDLKAHLKSELNMCSEKVTSVFERFKEKELIWDQEPGRYKPSIPSLMTYVLAQFHADDLVDMFVQH